MGYPAINMICQNVRCNLVIIHMICQNMRCEKHVMMHMMICDDAHDDISYSMICQNMRCEKHVSMHMLCRTCDDAHDMPHTSRCEKHVMMHMICMCVLHMACYI